jgi:hypothetical protein
MGNCLLISLISAIKERGGKGGGGLLVAGYIDLIDRAICARLTACNLSSRQKEMNFCLYSSFFQHLQKLF